MKKKIEVTVVTEKKRKRHYTTYQKVVRFLKSHAKLRDKKGK